MRALIVATALVAALLGVEVGLLLAGIYPPMPYGYPGEHANREHPNFEPDPVVGWRMRPDREFILDGKGGAIRYRADAAGHRVGPTPSTATGPLIVLAGDSFFWGANVQYEDSMAALLERRFSGVRIDNLSQPGFGVDQIVQAVTQQGLPQRPALVIVGIYPNDLARGMTAYREDLGFEKPTFCLDGGKLRRLTAADQPSAPMRWLEDHSRLLGLWRRAQRNAAFEYGVGSWWALHRALLDDMRAQVAAAGCPLVLVHVPLYEWRRFGGLEAWCSENRVPLVDPVQHDPQPPSDLYFSPDGHFTPKGQRYLTDLVADWIEHHGPKLGG